MDKNTTKSTFMKTCNKPKKNLVELQQNIDTPALKYRQQVCQQAVNYEALLQLQTFQ
jgi:hypothetical protein